MKNVPMSPADICWHFADQHSTAVCNGDMKLLRPALQQFQIST